MSIACDSFGGKMSFKTNQHSGQINMTTVGACRDGVCINKDWP
jgi:hypothetical protein